MIRSTLNKTKPFKQCRGLIGEYCDVNYSFNQLLNIKEKSQHSDDSSLWCRIVDAFQTVNSESVDSHKLKELVQQFNLAGDLMS